MFRLSTCLLLLSCSLAFGGLQCRDDNGHPVDWFVVYKLPIMTNQKDFLLRRGLGYVYMTSDKSQSDWKLSLKSINDSTSMIGRTLAVLYNDTQNFLHILYNDDPPSSSAGMSFGHTKGVVLTDGTDGVWLVHSSPKFPIEPVTDTKVTTENGVVHTSRKNSYFYPKSAVKYGQSFLCLSLPGPEMNSLGTQLMYNKVKIYSTNIPDPLRNLYPNLTSAATRKYIRTPPWFHKVTLTTKGGDEFVSYAKAGAFNKDLYSDWVAPDLNSDLNVETWSNGAGELPSNCKNKFKVMDVKQVSVKINQTGSMLQFKNSQDHSKWAVTTDQNTDVICIGDINRMAAQLKRGGGTVCFKNERVWKKYAKAVTELEPCPLHHH